ncbi:MAG: TetM/TetW/TetO/TetS family tetracycline resistance ribosomal protection protein [Eubacteriales bacterium]|nr:TetM/TetW/TetO/TetS family tetracycline resistance ribosomal protection protein [Eubacteriales bacterium]
MKKTIGILAHVDAGKTTFSEQVLFRMGALRSLGRVDHQDAFLDAHPIEKRRGITIFSDQAVFQAGEDTYYWLDTPGHVDFSPEMERAIDAMDYAIVVVSCVEGVQSHTETVWRLLKKHQVPTFLFLNKIDRAGADPTAVVEQIRARLSPEAVCCDGLTPDSMPDTLMESIAERDEAALDQLLQGNTDPAFYQNILMQEIRSRALFPVFSGAALSGAGIDAFLKMLLLLTRTEYAALEGAPFSAKVYKIRHEKQGGRVCFFKVLSGSVQVRDEVCGQKITELRQYQGMKYQLMPRCSAGDLCAVPGLNGVKIGDILGANAARGDHSESEPMLQSTVTFDPPVRSDQVLRALRELEEEDPTLCVENDSSGLSIRVMGEIQLDVLTELLQERYGLNVRFGNRRVIFLETIAEPAIGIGHYEPLRHYAEVHLRLVPGPRGSGIRFESKCHVDTLGLNWQRLIETHVFEKQHRGVLTGAALTDVTVQLLTGRAHLKHTEGGDFREATYRAIRNALMNAKSVLLEPVCAFTLRAPAELYGRLAGDMTRLRADCEPPAYAGDMVEISGQATFREISEYARNLAAQTHGRGALTYRLDHYTPARDADALVAESGYNPLADDTPDSVFCAKGAGFVVHWQDVPAYAHLPQEYCD